MSETTTLLLVRHGETDWNRERRVQGHTDIPLNPSGRAQALALAAELRDETVDAVYSSDLIRARDTATAIAEPRGLPVAALPALREKHFGTWEGLTDSEVESRFPQARSGHWGDAETRDEMSVRVLAAVREIAARHAGSTVVIVTHGGPLRAIQREIGVADGGSIANCHLLRVSALDGRLVAAEVER